jgi:hypothetical protein
MRQFMLENAKALIAWLTAFGTWGGTSLADDGIEAAEWFGLTGVFVTALAVWLTTNAPSDEQLKELAEWKEDAVWPPELPDVEPVVTDPTNKDEPLP